LYLLCRYVSRLEPLPYDFMPDAKLSSLLRARGIRPLEDRNALLFQAKGDATMRAWAADSQRGEDELQGAQREL